MLQELSLMARSASLNYSNLNQQNLADNMHILLAIPQIAGVLHISARQTSLHVVRGFAHP